MPFHVYILRCADGSLYIGHTSNLADRERRHNDGRGRGFTAARRPVRIIYAEAHPSRTAAVQRERQLKRWSAEKKVALAAGDVSKLKLLSKRRC